MSVIEEALRTAEAESERRRLEEEGYPGLSGMIAAGPRAERPGPRRVLLAAVLVLLLAGGVGWFAWEFLVAPPGGAEAGGAGRDAVGLPAAALDTSGAERGDRTAAEGARDGGSPPRPPAGRESSPGEAAAGTGAAPGRSGPPVADAASGGRTETASGERAEERPRSRREAASGGTPAETPAEPAPEGAAREGGAADAPAGAAEEDAREEEAGAEEALPPGPGETPGEEAADQAASRDSAERLLRDGVLLADAGDVEGAVERYRAAIAADSSLLEAYSRLGEALTREGEGALAVGVLRHAVERDPGYRPARTNLGIALLESGRHREAVEVFRALLTSGSPPFEAYANLGVAYRRMGRLEAARSALERALQVEPGQPLVHYNLARVLEELGQPLEAVPHYEAFLESGAESADLRARVRLYVDRLRRGGGRR